MTVGYQWRRMLLLAWFLLHQAHYKLGSAPSPSTGRAGEG
jgi:hypothetical protein